MTPLQSPTPMIEIMDTTLRDGEQTNGVPVKEAVAHIVGVIDARINDSAGEKLHSD